MPVAPVTHVHSCSREVVTPGASHSTASLLCPLTPPRAPSCPHMFAPTAQWPQVQQHTYTYTPLAVPTLCRHNGHSITALRLHYNSCWQHQHCPTTGAACMCQPGRAVVQPGRADEPHGGLLLERRRCTVRRAHAAYHAHGCRYCRTMLSASLTGRKSAVAHQLHASCRGPSPRRRCRASCCAVMSCPLGCWAARGGVQRAPRVVPWQPTPLQ